MRIMMSKIIIFISVLAVGLIGHIECFGQGKVTRIQPSANKESAKHSIRGTSNGHEWVDLGLPSGTKWATCNVGTDKFDYYGDYFVWGSLQVVKDENISWSKRPSYYNLGDSFSGLVKYDPARSSWGMTWRTPTKEEFVELVEYCQFTWTDEYDGGVWVQSKRNGQKIYLPACGGCSGTQGYDYVRIAGLYWTSTAAPTENTYRGVPDYAFCMQFISENKDGSIIIPTIRTDPRQACLSIRPVMSK